MTDDRRPPLATEIDRRKLLAGTAAVVGGSVIASALPESVVSAATLPAEASAYVPLTPFRVLDTRNGVGRPSAWVGENRLRIGIGGYTDPGTGQQVARDATAIVVGVASINGDRDNHVQVFPSYLTSVPTVASMNLRAPGQVVANMVTSRISGAGEFDIFTLHRADIVVDVLGYYRPVREATSAGRLQSITSTRVYDSRAGYPRPTDRGFVDVDVTDWTRGDSSAVVINLAAVLSNGPGHVAAVPIWQTATPETSTLNLKFAGDNVSGSAIVPIATSGGRRKIRIYAHTSCDVIVDVNGYFTGEGAAASTDGLFVPVTPQRILDTRGLWPNKLGGALGRLWDGWIVEAPLTKHAGISSNLIGQIGAAAVNVTAFESRGFPTTAGHFTLSAAGLPVPFAASLNWSAPGSYAANHAISEVSTDGVQVHTAGGAGAVIDLAGYYLGRPKVRRLRAAAPENQQPPAIPPTWKMHIPNLWDSAYRVGGRVHNVIDHASGDAAVDSGQMWHWTNTGNMLDNRDVFILGHRTSAGGPLRHIHELQNGSLMYIDTADGRRYTFRYVGMRLATAEASSIAEAAKYYNGTTVSLVACTAGYSKRGKAWYEPTSLDWRIVSTFEFVDWEVIAG